MPLELLPILHVAALAIKVAREQIPVLQAHKERCTLLINRSDRLLVEISAQYENGGTSIIQPKISILESACISVRDTVRELSGKGLAWRLLHQEQMEKAIMASEAKLNDACNVFQVGAHISIGEMQAAIAEAAKRDHQQFIVYLEGISQNDQRIIDALRASNLRLEETLTALLKHIQSRSNAGNDEQPSERFIRRAVDVLKKVSIGFVRDDIAPWEITSLEVEYEAVEDACIGVGGFGKVFRGYWHGEVVAVKEMHETLAMDVRNDRHFKVETDAHPLTKYANILIGDDEKAMICDFGLSQLKDQVVSTQSNSRIIQGTPNYMAPEYLEGDPIDYPVDVYSFGMTAWQIHTGLIPFNDVPRRSFYRWVIDKKNRPNYPDSMNKTLWTLLQECWQHDPVRRPTFTGVEATLKSLTKSSSRRLSMGSSQMLMLPQLPSPPVSPTGSSGYRRYLTLLPKLVKAPYRFISLTKVTTLEPGNALITFLKIGLKVLSRGLNVAFYCGLTISPLFEAPTF
ncbi:Dual specificity protein kinase shkA [Psilocybe cubensis]|uniref:Dual specificity protein kinase shkA n=1 Tax=Psilocybe cubensis TaxID=181762 RepID=A0ACB8GMG7_PSICU|nr:Dual specificity protein kinase shkA [Psilocybe cubensis]KAH9476950.1 Dual specificity protein kinase shkA [Psilocybe cubensis]